MAVENPSEAPKEEKKEAKKEEARTEPKAKKRKKVSRLTLEEVENNLKQAQESMGGQQSNYVHHLRARKKVLTS